MEETQRITLALFNAHQAWSARGILSRGLISLLFEFDNGRFLAQETRSQLKVDLGNLTSVCFMTQDYCMRHLTLLISGSPAAFGKT